MARANRKKPIRNITKKNPNQHKKMRVFSEICEHTFFCGPNFMGKYYERRKSIYLSIINTRNGLVCNVINVGRFRHFVASLAQLVFDMMKAKRKLMIDSRQIMIGEQKKKSAIFMIYLIVSAFASVHFNVRFIAGFWHLSVQSSDFDFFVSIHCVFASNRCAMDFIFL